MYKSKYLHLLSEASINDTSKFRPVDTKRPKTSERRKPEKQISAVISKVLPKPTADSICSQGFRVAHLYGLPKTHKEQLAMHQMGPLQDPITRYWINYTGTQITQWDFQNKGKSGWTGMSSFALEVPLRNLRPSVIHSIPCDPILKGPILSATYTYNYALAKWLDEKLKPLSCNQYMVTDTFEFVNEVQSLEINRGDILVSYNVTNVPVDETIHIWTDTAVNDDWFNKTPIQRPANWTTQRSH